MLRLHKPSLTIVVIKVIKREIRRYFVYRIRLQWYFSELINLKYLYRSNKVFYAENFECGGYIMKALTEDGFELGVFIDSRILEKLTICAADVLLVRNHVSEYYKRLT